MILQQLRLAAEAIAQCDGRVKVYQTLRTAHLERAKLFEPAVYLYQQHRYDFDPKLASQLPVFRLNPWLTAWLLIRSRVTVLEVNEPLMREGLFGSLLAVLASNRLNRSKVYVVSYALENLDPFTRPVSRLRSKVRLRLDRYLSHRLLRSLDRLCFGTTGAQELYHQLMPATATTQQTLIEALPALCTCPQIPRSQKPTMVFIGDFSLRKGLDAVLAAWPRVAKQIPDARMVVIGKGNLAAPVRELAASDSRVSVLYDPPRCEIHEQLRRAHVLVLPSRRTPRWREQVGLPIVEGLAHQCRIVSSDETGLATWLENNNHLVLPHASIDSFLPDTLLRALQEASTWSSSEAELPSVDGRLAADLWMHRKA